MVGQPAPPDRDDSTLTIEKLTDIYFVPGMQPQLIRPAWTLCGAACPRRPRDRITVLLLRRISPLLAREGPNSNFEPLCQLAPVVNGWGFSAVLPDIVDEQADNGRRARLEEVFWAVSAAHWFAVPRLTPAFCLLVCVQMPA